MHWLPANNTFQDLRLIHLHSPAEEIMAQLEKDPVVVTPATLREGLEG